MTTKCQQCKGKAQVFLCRTCSRDLQRQLADLPWWIDRLVEAITGQTRLGDSGRRKRGDDEPLRVNMRASELLDDVQNTLGTIVRDLLESRGVEIPAQLAACAPKRGDRG